MSRGIDVVRLADRADRSRPVSVVALAIATALLCLSLPGCQSSTGSDLVRTDDGFQVTESGSLRLGARSRFRAALESMAADDLEEAITALEASAEEAPDHAAPRVNLALALLRAERLDEAEEVLRETVQAHPKHPVAHNELGIVYRRLGRFDAARESYERAISLYGDFHVAHRNLGVLCDLFLEDTACALAHYRRYLEIVDSDEQVSMWITDLERRAR